jgi:hypothetical protein
MKASLILMGLLFYGGVAAAQNAPRLPSEGIAASGGLHQDANAAALFAALPDAWPKDYTYPILLIPPHAAQANLELSNGDQHVISIFCVRIPLIHCRFDVGSEIKEGIAIVEPLYLLNLLSGGGI